MVLGASFDSVEDNAAFAKKFTFAYPLLCDTDRKIGLAYGACDTAEDKYPKRISYVIEGNGVVRQAFAKVDPKTHPGDVLGLLQR